LYIPFFVSIKIIASIHCSAVKRQRICNGIVEFVIKCGFTQKRREFCVYKKVLDGFDGKILKLFYNKGRGNQFL